MIATLKGEIRGTREIKRRDGTPVKTKDGKQLYSVRMEMKGHGGFPYFVDVVSTKNGRKLGTGEIPVEVALDRDKSGVVRGLKCWEVV